MGKHSAGDEGTFWRSVVLTVLKWITLVLLPIAVGIGVWMSVNANDDPPRRAAPPRPSPSVTASPSPAASPAQSPSPAPSPAISPGTRVQVLDGSSVEGSGTDAKKKLQEAGLRVIGPANAARDFDQTTVFYQPGNLALAQQIAEILGATKVEPAPDTVDEQIPVTVVTGDDYSTG